MLHEPGTAPIGGTSTFNFTLTCFPVDKRARARSTTDSRKWTGTSWT
jgi:hypothetical protein